MIARVACAGLLGTWAGLAFGPVYGGFPAPFLVAVVASAAAATLAGVVAVLLPRLPSPLVGVVGMAAVAGVVVALVKPGRAVVDGPWQVLTAALPVEPEGPALAAAALVAGGCTLAAVLLAAYSRSPLPAAVPALACLVAALATGASARPLPAWYAVAGIVLLAALLVRWRLHPSLAVGAVLAVAAALLAGLLGPGIQGDRPPADARALVPAPVVPRAGVSPFQQYAALRDGTLALKLSGTVSAPVGRLRMVTLTEFDGSYWTVGARYRRAGTTLPPPPASVAARSTVTQDVRVEVAGPLAWLPTAGRPTGVTVAGLGLDEDSGDLVVAADQPVPEQYRATSVLVEPSEDQVRVADPLPGRRLAVPDDVAAFAAEAVRDQPPGAARLLALYARLAKDLRFRYDDSPQAAGGHGLFQIRRLLADHRGTSEQYASAYAVMARHLGFDARVVMGFLPRYSDSTFTVTGRDVDAWAEVRLSGLGWVSVDPSPRDNRTGESGPAPADRRAADDPVRRAAEPPPAVDPSGPAAALPPLRDPSPAGGGGPAWWLLSALAVVVIVAGVPLAKAARRLRRRRAADLRVAAVGAWLETVDRLRDAGLPARRGRPSAEVTAVVGGGSIVELAALVDRAAYAPEPPDRALRDAAWTAGRKAVRTAPAPALRRIVAWINPRSLFP